MKKLRNRIKHLLKYVGYATLVAAPWYIRNIVLFGNPFFPFYNHLFPLEWGTVPAYLQADLQIDSHEMLKWFTCDPLTCWFTGTMYDTAPWTRADLPSLVGPVLLALVPLIIIFWKQIPSAGKWALGVAAAYLVWWCVVQGILEHRYLLPAYPVIACGVGLGISRLLENKS